MIPIKNKVYAAALAVLLTSSLQSAETISFTSPNYTNASLDGQQSWNAESGWSVSDAAGSGNTRTTSSGEDAIRSNSIHLSSGETLSLSVNFQLEGSYTAGAQSDFVYMFHAGLMGASTAGSYSSSSSADATLQMLRNTSGTGTSGYRLLEDFAVISGAANLNGFNTGDEFVFDYSLTMGPNAATTVYTVELTNVSDANLTTTVGTVTGIDTTVYDALAGSGAYVFIRSGNNLTGASAGITSLKVNSVVITEPNVTPITDPDPVLPNSTLNVEVLNPSVEITDGSDGDYLNEGDVLGWSGNATLHRGNTDYGNGGWALSLERSQAALQQTARGIAAGEAYSLRFDAALLNSGGSGNQSFSADFYVVDGPVANVVATRTYTLNTSTAGDWGHDQLIVPAGDLNAYAGEPIGVQFRGLGLSNGVSILVDNVRLEVTPASPASGEFNVNWNNTPNQVWPGPGFWANRTQDWEVSAGRVQCVNGSQDRRTVHRAGTSIRGNGENFTLSVRTGLHAGSNASSSRTGFLLGAGPNLDWRAQLLVHDGSGRDFGTFFGITGNGQAIIEDLNASSAVTLDTGANPGSMPSNTRLELSATYNSVPGTYTLTLDVYNHGSSTLISSASTTLSSERLRGGLGLLSHRGSSARYWYDDFSGSGGALKPETERNLAIVGSLYALSQGTLKINAQLSPVSVPGTNVTLETFNGVSWDLVDTVAVDNTDGLSSYTATFKVTDWDDSKDTDYRLGVTLDGTTYYRSGTIQRNPVDKNPLVVASTTCQRIAEGNVQANGNDWTPVGIWHPHDQLWTHISKHEPDVVLALGDQIYEWTSPTPEDNSSDFNRQHDYLYKWYFWVLQVQEITKNVPTVAIPDDHDIFQGNFWGEGGNANTGNSENDGGYESPGSWLRMVERTQTNNLPDADPYNVIQPAPPTGNLNMNVYFTGMVYGGVGFAILEDRKFKTGPDNPTNPGPEDQHLLGERQHDFLSNWATDWEGQKIKFALSQTPFGSVTTHGSTDYGYYGVNSTDGAGWPVHRRNEAWEHLRLARMFQIAGDLHVASVVHHGVDGPADAGYSFCAPAVGNFFPRIWDPPHTSSGTIAQNPETYDSYLGDYYSENGLTFPHHRRYLAASNSYEYYEKTRGLSPSTYHDRGIGYGLIRLDKQSRRITFECWPTHADPQYPSTGSQYKDWPITINQTDNDGRTPLGFLPLVNTGHETDPVVSVYNETTGDLIYSQRILGNSFRPPVYDLSTTYRTDISFGDDPVAETLTGQSASAQGAASIDTFIALQPSIESGASTLLHWDVASVSSLTIDHGLGDVTEFTVNGIGHIAVSPVSDTTYTLTLNGGITAQATVQVFATKADWLDTHFTPTELLDVFTSGDAADPDGDGFSNGEEFRFQTDPRDGTDFPSEGSVIQVAGSSVSVEFDMPFPIGSNIYTPIIEVSTDLSNWAPLPANSYHEVSRETTGPDTTRLVIQLQDILLPHGKRFYRASW